MKYKYMELKAASALALNVAIIYALIYAQYIYGGVASYLVFVVLLASRLKVFAEFFHEAVHYNISRKYRAANDMVGSLLGVPLFFSFKTYRKEHLFHHRKTGDNVDPTQIWFANHGLYSPRWRLFKIILLPLLGNQIPNYLRDIVSDLKEDARFRVAALIYVLILSAAIYTWGFKAVILLWLIPIFWMYPVLNFWNELIDHYNAPEGTRNFVSSPILTAILTPLNSNYHALHHSRPDIPWFALNKQFDGKYAKYGFRDIVKQFLRKGSYFGYKYSP